MAELKSPLDFVLKGPYTGKQMVRQAYVSASTHDGRGIASIDGKVTFIDGALPGENVLFTYHKKYAHYDEGRLVKTITVSPERLKPACRHYGLCGGCSLQHIGAEQQLQLKQAGFLEQLAHFGGVKPECMRPPIRGPSWGYRRRARLGVRYVAKKQAVLVGFREKDSRYVAALQGCEVLDPRLADLLLPLQELFGRLQAYQSIPQIEMAAGDTLIALVLRHLCPLHTADLEQLQAFAQAHALYLYLQPSDFASIQCLWPEDPGLKLSYCLPQQSLELLFEPYDFIQVNAIVNQKLVAVAVELLELQAHERVLDLFCGLGNFTLALAKSCRQVVGVEINLELVARASQNAHYNNIHNAHFYVADLMASAIRADWAQQTYSKILLDPPRTGAWKVLQQFPA